MQSPISEFRQSSISSEVLMKKGIGWKYSERGEWISFDSKSYKSGQSGWGGCRRFLWG